MIMKDYIVRKEEMTCPFCEEVKEIELRKIKQIDKVKNVNVEYEAFV